MMTPHGDVQANAAAYVLGSLDADDRAAFDAHLATCSECTAEVQSFRGVTDALAQAVPERTPRPELRDRVLRTFSSAAAAPATARATQAYGTRSWLPLAASIVLTVAVGAYAARLQGRVNDLETRLEQAVLQASTAERAMADARRVATELQSSMGVLAAPDLVRIDLAGQPTAPRANARALWSRARGMVFAVSDLPPLPAGRVYQVWVVTAQAPISAGLMTPDPAGGGLTYFMTPPDIPAPTAVAVTLEPAGGVPAPTGQMYLVGKPGASL
jgi:anti-sigma-K factor RskA